MAAVKLLLAPEIAPDSYRPRLEALSRQTDLEDIETLRTLIAPDRRSVYPIVLSRHAAGNIESWDRPMNLRFFGHLREQGYSNEDIADLGASAHEVRRSLRELTVYELARSLRLSKELAVKVLDERQFPISTLQRLIENADVQEFLGISFDERQNLVGSIQKREFNRGFRKMVTDVAEGEVDSRKLNSKPEIRDYLQRFGSAEPNRKKAGSFVIGAGSSRPPAGGKKDTGKGPAKPRTALIPPQFPCDTANMRIHDLVHELKTAPFRRYRNLVGIGLRSLLEMSLGHHLQELGLIEAVVARQRGKRPKLPRNWHPGAREMVEYVVNENPKILKNENTRKALENLLQKRGAAISLDELCLYAHNELVSPTGEELVRFWERLERLFRVTLTDPSASGLEGTSTSHAEDT